MVVRQKAKQVAQARAGKLGQSLREGAGRTSAKVAARATAAKGKAASKLAERDIAAIAEHVVADLTESGAKIAQHASGGIDEIAHLVAERLGKTSDLVQETLTKQVDKIVDLVAARLGQSSNRAQQTLEQRAGEIAEMVAAKLSAGGGATAKSGAEAAAVTPDGKKVKVTTLQNTKLKVVKLDWKEVYYSNCPLVSASNVDEGLGLTKQEFKKIGVNYRYLRSNPENDWYPHYIHNLDNFIRFGGLFPPINVHADIRRTRLLGVTQMPAEGGVMMVRAKDDIFRMADLKGKKIGLSKSMNQIKNDWWRIQEHQGIELMLKMNGMTMEDIQLVEFPYADDWYNDPAMMGPPMELSIDLWMKRDHKNDLAFRPLEAALEEGAIDAMYLQTKPLQQVSEMTGKFAAIEDLSRYPDWRLQVANIPAAITCTEEMATKHPELAVTFMKGMILAGRWANQNKRAAAEILDQQTFYRDIEHTYQGIRDVDLVPNLNAQNLVSVEIGKNFMLSHGYIKNDFDVKEWAAPEIMEQAAKELLAVRWEKATADKLAMKGSRLG